jgi:hypothetical protein
LDLIDYPILNIRKKKKIITKITDQSKDLNQDALEAFQEKEMMRTIIITIEITIKKTKDNKVLEITMTKESITVTKILEKIAITMISPAKEEIVIPEVITTTEITIIMTAITTKIKEILTTTTTIIIITETTIITREITTLTKDITITTMEISKRMIELMKETISLIIMAAIEITKIITQETMIEHIKIAMLHITTEIIITIIITLGPVVEKAIEKAIDIQILIIETFK